MRRHEKNLLNYQCAPNLITKLHKMNRLPFIAKQKDIQIVGIRCEENRLRNEIGDDGDNDKRWPENPKVSLLYLTMFSFKGNAAWNLNSLNVKLIFCNHHQERSMCPLSHSFIRLGSIIQDIVTIFEYSRLGRRRMLEWGLLSWWAEYDNMGTFYMIQ